MGRSVRRRGATRPGAARRGGPLVIGSGSLFSEPTLIVLETVNSTKGNSFAITDAAIKRLATAQEVSGSTVGRMFGKSAGTNKYTSQRLEVTDPEGRLIFRISRPAKVMKSRIIVEDGQGMELGVIRQESMIGGSKFAIECGSNRIGSIEGEGLLTKRYLIRDVTGTEVAKITDELPPEALESIRAMAASALTGADHYVVNIHQALPDPLRSLVVVAALAIDIALHQD